MKALLIIAAIVAVGTTITNGIDRLGNPYADVPAAMRCVDCNRPLEPFDDPLGVHNYHCPKCGGHYWISDKTPGMGGYDFAKLSRH